VLVLPLALVQHLRLARVVLVLRSEVLWEPPALSPADHRLRPAQEVQAEHLPLMGAGQEHSWPTDLRRHHLLLPLQGKLSRRV
jgi:hypothetical protein